MKNLFATTTLALVMLSLLTVSCGKPKKGEIPAPPPENGAITTWTPKGSDKPKTTKSDIKYGDVGVSYAIIPNMPVCAACPGTWSLVIVGPKNEQHVAVFSAKNGSVGFTPLTPGTYTLTLTYKCACAPDLVIVVTIVVA